VYWEMAKTIPQFQTINPFAISPSENIKRAFLQRINAVNLLVFSALFDSIHGEELNIYIFIFSHRTEENKSLPDKLAMQLCPRDSLTEKLVSDCGYNPRLQ
jgi:hypothetical protein